MIAHLHRLLLPSVRVADRAQLPAKPGCYYVSRWFSLLYVGRAETSIKSRWNDHHKLPRLRKGDRIHYWVMPAVMVRDRESVDIDRFNPPLNFRRESREWRGRLIGYLGDMGSIAITIIAAYLIWLKLR